MCYDEMNYQTDNQRKSDYLIQELAGVQSDKTMELEAAFKMDLQNTPESPKELVQWIKDGWFTFNPALDADGSWHSGLRPWGAACHHYIEFKNPNRDTTGFDAATKKMYAASTAAERLIEVGTPAEGLAALNAFEAGTYH